MFECQHCGQDDLTQLNRSRCKNCNTVVCSHCLNTELEPEDGPYIRRIQKRRHRCPSCEEFHLFG